MEIRRFGIGDAELFRDVRLRALEDAPYAFSSWFALRRRSIPPSGMTELQRAQPQQRVRSLWPSTVAEVSGWQVGSSR